MCIFMELTMNKDKSQQNTTCTASNVATEKQRAPETATHPCAPAVQPSRWFVPGRNGEMHWKVSTKGWHPRSPSHFSGWNPKHDSFLNHVYQTSSVSRDWDTGVSVHSEFAQVRPKESKSCLISQMWIKRTTIATFKIVLPASYGSIDLLMCRPANQYWLTNQPERVALVWHARMG